MKHYILLRKSAGGPVAVDYEQLSGRPKVFVVSKDPKWIIRCMYYAFIASLPFETADIGAGGTSLPKLVAFAFIAVTLLQPRLCFKFAPKAFWYFTIHLCVVALMGMLQDPVFYSRITAQLWMHTQLLILFWVSYNLVQYEWIGKGTLWALAISCLVLALLQALGSASIMTGGGRVSALRENPNSLATVLSLGLIALVG